MSGHVRRHPEDLREAVLPCLRERDVRCIRHEPSPVDREAQGVQEDVRVSVALVEHAQDLARDRDSVRVLAALLAQAVCCPDRAKAPRRDALPDALLHVVVAISATRSPKKAR